MIKKFITIIVFCTALFTLLGLSYWQYQRLIWKTDIIAKLDSEYQKDPALNKFNFDDLTQLNDQENPIKFGQVSGKFAYDKEILVGPKPFDGAIGYQVITPLKLTDKGFIFVNRGWVDATQKDQIKNMQPKQNITISGIFRKPDWNKFTPNNSPDNDIWTKLDINQIAQAKKIEPIAPMMLYATSMSVDFTPLILQEQKWYPRNKHKQYALFWLSMALVLLGVFGLAFIKNKKSK